MADPKAEFVQGVYEQALAAGLTDAAARVMASQAAIESSYGQNAPGYNYFGVTAGVDWNGPTMSRPDLDAKGQPITNNFRVYPTADAGIADRIAYMDQHFPGFNSADSVPTALASLQKGVYGKYYTAPQDKYEMAVNTINSRYLPASHPVPPASIPFSGKGIVDISRGGQVGDYTVPADPFTTVKRSGTPTGIVFHHTGGSSLSGAINGSLDKTSKQYGTGASYYIDRDGMIYQYAPDDVVRVGIREKTYRTDAGKPTAGMTNDNTFSVEVVAPDSQHFTDAQKQAAAELAAYLVGKYKIDPSMIVGHGDIQGGPGGNKQPTEGVPLAAYVRDALASNPALQAINAAAPTDTTFGRGTDPLARSDNAFTGRDLAARSVTRDPATTVDVIRSAAAYGYRRPAGTAATDPGKLAAEFPNEGFDVLAGGLGAIGDPRTSSLIGGDTFDTIGDGPTNWFVGHDDVAPFFGSTATGHSSKVIQAPIPHAYPLAQPVAPTPMPGRPADVRENAPQPMPGRPASLDAHPAAKSGEASPDATAAPKPAKQTIRVGKHDYEVGATFDQGGFHYVVTPTGIQKSRIPTGEPTVIGDIIGGIVKQKAAEAAPAVKKALADATTATVETAKTKAGELGAAATQTIGTITSGLGSTLGNLFGGGNVKPADQVARIVHQTYGGDQTVDRPEPAIVWGKPTIPVSTPQPAPPVVAPRLQSNDWTKIWSEITVPDHVKQTPIAAPTVQETRAEQARPVATATVKPPTSGVRSVVETAGTRVGQNLPSTKVRTQSDSKPDYRTVTTVNPAYTEWVKRQNVQTRGEDTKELHAVQNTPVKPPPQFVTTRVARPAPTVTRPTPTGIPATQTQRATQNAAATQVAIASGRTVPVGSIGTSQNGRYVYQVQADGSIKELGSGRITSPAPVQNVDPLQAAVEAARQQGETYDRSRDLGFNPNGGANGGSYSH
jgi:hypothetical protein